MVDDILIAELVKDDRAYSSIESENCSRTFFLWKKVLEPNLSLLVLLQQFGVIWYASVISGSAHKHQTSRGVDGSVNFMLRFRGRNVNVGTEQCGGERGKRVPVGSRAFHRD